MSSSPTLLAAAEDKRFHEPSLLLPNMHSSSTSTLPPTRTAQHQFSHASCSPLVDTAFVPQPLRAVRARRTKSREAARRATEGDHRRARVHPLSLFWSLARSLSPLISICNLSAVGGRSHCNKLPHRPTRWTTPPSVQPPILTNSDNLTPDSDLVSQNLRQQRRPAAEGGGGPVLLRPHSLNLSTYLPPISSPPLI